MISRSEWRKLRDRRRIMSRQHSRWLMSARKCLTTFQLETDWSPMGSKWLNNPRGNPARVESWFPKVNRWLSKCKVLLRKAIRNATPTKTTLVTIITTQGWTSFVEKPPWSMFRRRAPSIRPSLNSMTVTRWTSPPPCLSHLTKRRQVFCLETLIRVSSLLQWTRTECGRTPRVEKTIWLPSKLSYNHPKSRRPLRSPMTSMLWSLTRPPRLSTNTTGWILENLSRCNKWRCQSSRLWFLRKLTRMPVWAQELPPRRKSKWK